MMSGLYSALTEFVRLGRRALSSLPAESSPQMLNLTFIQKVSGARMSACAVTPRGQTLDDIPLTFMHNFSYVYGPPALEQSVRLWSDGMGTVRAPAAPSAVC